MNEGFGVQPTYSLNDRRDYDDGVFGGNGAWVFFLFFLLAWGGNGFGGFGGNAGGAANMISNDFMYTNLKSTLDNGFTQQANQAFATQRELQQGFCNVGNAICNSTYEVTRNIDGVSHQISDCCCTTNRNIDSVKFENERNTCAIITNADRNARDTQDVINAGIQRIMDARCQDKLDALRLENQTLSFQLSQNAQTNAIINQIKPYPIPAYPACNPWATNGLLGGCGCNGGLI